MAISLLPSAPSRNDAPAIFTAKADAWVAALNLFITQANATAAAMNINSIVATSVSSVLIATGSKSFTVSAGKSFQPGMYLVIAATASPSTNSMFGQVTSYSGTTLIVNVGVIQGSGTFAAWTISPGSPSGATYGANTFAGDQTVGAGVAFETSISTLASSATPDIWTGTSNIINYTGTVTATGFAAAPQAGVTRTLICAGACSFTAGANMLIDNTLSALTYTAAAGDTIEVLAVTTTQFRLKIHQANDSSKLQSLHASVAADALTITLNPTSLDFRSPTLASGVVNRRNISSAISLVVPSGATLGAPSGTPASSYLVLAMDNAGTVELAITNMSNTVRFDETTLVDTFVLSSLSDLSTAVCSTAARTGLPYRVVGFITVAHTFGAWNLAPTLIQGYGGQAVAAMSSLGYGARYQDVTLSRTSGVNYYNTTGRPIMVSVFATTTAAGAATLTAAGDVGGYTGANTVYSNAAGAKPILTFIVPPNAMYSVTYSGVAGAITTWQEFR